MNLDTKRNNLDNSPLRMPSFHSEEERGEYINAIFSGEIQFPLIAGGMGIAFSNPKNYVKNLLAEGVLPTMSASLPSLGERDVYEKLFGNDKIEGTRERIEFFREKNKTVLIDRIRQIRAEVPHAIIGINLMRAAGDYEAMLQAIGESKQVDILFVGAGIPTDLGETMENYPHMKYVPIVSSARVAEIMMKSAKRKGVRLPDAFYVELPQFAGGHLGAKDVETALDEKTFDPEKIVQEIRKIAETYYGEGIHVPILLAGGISYQEDIEQALRWGYDGVSMGTRFLLTTESGMPNKVLQDVYLKSGVDTQTTMESPAGLPSRSIGKPNIVKRTIEEIRNSCVACIGGGKRCKHLQTKGEESYCIARELSAVTHEEKGICFTGARLGTIRNDSLYQDADGNRRVPSIREAVDFVLNG